ncbi:hypothetical protein SCHPADRAFT_865968 [Schizopora paradoxa]|uniref:DUF4211 domain-containing protein n=1 Tax=Schizopora paradoxa TaxID=27342 RepID=A0A0H2S385_9AGAM|nr:hypothetical protein SCHPADRAFT_865968 [Schizopora paradoxa]
MPPKRRAARSTQRVRQQSLLDHFQPSSSPSRPSTSKKARKARARSPTPVDDDSEPEILEITPARPPPSSSKAPYTNRTPHTSPLRPSRLFNTPSSVRRSQKANPLEVDVSASSDDSDSDIGRIKFESKGKGKAVQEDSDESESIGMQRSRRQRTVVDSDDEEACASESATIASHASDVGQPTKKRKSRIIRHTKDSSSESDNPSPRKLVKKELSEASDEDEDMSGIDEEQIVSSRLRKKPTKLNAKQKLLAMLKSKRTGQHIEQGDDSDEESSGSSSGSSEADEDEDVDVIPGARPDRGRKNKRSVSDADEDEDDFIVDDADQSPTSILPSAYSMNQHQDMSHHFKIACQYFVHLAVTPEEDRPRIADELLTRQDDYFSIPLSNLRRKFSSIRDTITSSVWRPDYTRVLRKFPDFEVITMDFAVPYCDACRISGRKSKYIGRASGSPYDPKTFEFVSKSDSDSDSDESDSDKEDGPVVEYHLGRYCARRARLYHGLSHWEHSVYTTMSTEVTELQERGNEGNFFQMGTSARIEPPNDATDADEIIDWLDKRGVIDYEWARIKKLEAQASNIDVDAKKGDNPED